MNETILTGVLAIRLQGLNRELEWDGEKMRFTNIPDEEFKFYTEAFTPDVHPEFEKKGLRPVNAQQFVEELIRHTYRQGWKLPEMPG